MKPPPPRSSARPLKRFRRLPPCLIIVVALFFVAGCFSLCRAQPSLPVLSARSLSGQFIIIAAQQVSPLANDLNFLTNTDFVRLDPPLLAISAERIRKSLWQELGIDSAKPWSGQIFLALHAAQAPDESVTVISTRFNNAWNYRVELPDIVTRDRLTRALTGVILLEFANRNGHEHGAEVPAWLVDGLAAQLSEANSSGIILSSPSGLDQRIVASRSGWDLLKEAHRVLQSQQALTFDQLSWPTDDQLAGSDGGVYRASAQLFINELIALKNGRAHLRGMLQNLPDFYNWQIAFRQTFAAEFPQPVDLEKWWAVRTVNFAAMDAGPMWTSVTSRQKLDEILSVPVEYRATSNNLPAHVEASLQTVIRNFEPARQTDLLRAKSHDLQMAELRMSTQFASLAAQYHRVLADYLGDSPPPTRVVMGRNSGVRSGKSTVRDTLNRLDALDRQRRQVEAAWEKSMLPGRMPALTGRESNL